MLPVSLFSIAVDPESNYLRLLPDLPRFTDIANYNDGQICDRAHKDQKQIPAGLDEMFLWLTGTELSLKF